MILKLRVHRFLTYLKQRTLEFDFYITPISKIRSDIFRLLGVGNCTVVPYNAHARALIPLANVLHV